MDSMEQFAVTIGSKDEKTLQDVKDFVAWETEHGESRFNPRATDDVAIRTYLLDCRIRGENRAVLKRIASSLEHFYAWLKVEKQIPESPFEKFNLKPPYPDLNRVQLRHDAFRGLPDEREIARLRALNRLAESANRASDVRSLLEAALETMLDVMTLHTAWSSLRVGNGILDSSSVPPPEHGFFLAAARGLPPGLEKAGRLYLTRPPECHCQLLLRTGQLKRSVNVVECSRLRDSMQAEEDNNGLMFHASVPVTVKDQAIGIMNFASQGWQLLSASDLQFLTAGARQLGAALERAHLYDLIHIEHNRLEQELDMARKMQVSLLPKELPEIAGYSLGAFWQPAHETSGDYYNVFKLPGGRWGFIVADVCGKGAPAALRMVMTHSLVSERVEKELSPSVLLGQINQALCEQDMDMQFVTSFYAVLDPQTSVLRYAVAGHPPPLLRKASGRVEKLAGGGMAMGVDPIAQYEEVRLALAPGDSLVAFTDGVTDASNPSAEPYDMEQLNTAIGSAPPHAAGLVDHLRNTLVAWVKDAPNYDDITLLAIGRKG